MLYYITLCHIELYFTMYLIKLGIIFNSTKIFYYIITAARGVTVGTYTDLKWNELNIQIIIIACKSDLLKIDDAGSLKMARTLQGQVRTVALFIGAAVIYTSTETDTNTVKLRKYLISKLYPVALSVEDNIEVSTEHLQSL